MVNRFDIMKKISFGLIGSQGRMGQEIIGQTDERFDLKVACGSSRDLKDHMFQNVDVVIDFSTKESFEESWRLANLFQKPLVVGTTGIIIPQEKVSAPIFISPNMSLAVGFLAHITQQVASLFEFDIEITEAHHAEKIDSPSGTALMLGKKAAQGRGISFEPSFNRTGRRAQSEIGFSVMRGGALPGEHTVHFIGEHERLSFSHVCYSRAVFAKGALDVAAWILHKTPGLYSMENYLKEKLNV